MNQHHDQLIVLDFDHTLFNTTQFVTELAQYFSDTFSIPQDVFRQALHNVKSMHTTQDVTSLVEGLPHPNKEEMRKAVFELAAHHGPTVLHPDVLPFISRHQDTFDFFILSFGDWELQQAKIVGSGLGRIPFEIVQGSKAPAFGELEKQYNRIHFIDDKPENIDEVKQQYPAVTTYFIRRSEDGPYGKHGVVCQGADVEIENLEVVLE